MAMTELQASDIRPKSAFVQIIEIQEKTVNPTPVRKRPSESPHDEFLTEQRLVYVFYYVNIYLEGVDRI